MSARLARAVTESLLAMSRASDLDPARRLACKIPMSKEAVTRRLRVQSQLRDSCLAWQRIGRAHRLATDPSPET